jgi:hypothetical protein
MEAAPGREARGNLARADALEPEAEIHADDLRPKASEPPGERSADIRWLRAITEWAVEARQGDSRSRVRFEVCLPDLLAALLAAAPIEADGPNSGKGKPSSRSR